MPTGPAQALREIVEADDPPIVPFREDGKSYGTPTWIGSVAVDRNLYLRSQRDLRPNASPRTGGNANTASDQDLTSSQTL